MKDGDTVKLKDAVRTLLFKGNNQTYHQLYTKWGEKLDPEHVLEEYPRPQLRRNEYTVLNGYWSYSITEDGNKPESFEGRIIVPFSPESVLSGVNRQLKPEEFLWYERLFTIGEKYSAKRCLLHFGAVDQFCEVFINHVKVTEHMGGYLPFTVDITESIMEGENFLTVKVTDASETSYHSRGKQMLKRGGILYTAQSGIWQTVWLEWVPNNYIQDLKITPLVDQSSVNIEITMNNKDINSSLPHYFIEIYENQTLIQSVTSSFPVITIPLKGFHYWSPENPFLYALKIRADHDLVDSYFAMRKIDIKIDDAGIPRIFLNNEPYFQHGLLDQGYWPDGLYTSPSDEAMIFDISSAKELGFNMLRKHIKIEPLRWYYHCDRLGMLVWQDMVNGGERYNQVLVAHYPTLFPNLANHLKDHHYGMLARKSEEGRKATL
jgi:beta-galactosidase/beta-glucuronidase